MIPKRAIGALVTTAFALALLFSFKTPGVPHLAASSTSGTAIVGQPGATAAPTAASDGTTTASGAGTTSDSSGSAAATATPDTGLSGSTGSSGTTSTSSYRDGTVTGDLVQTRYGDVQVQVTISGGRITDVTALQLPGGDPRSSRISQVAEPMLRESALAAQSANIDLLSGATYTSGAYAQSLQSALDQAAA